MGLEEQQAALAKIYTSNSLRKLLENSDLNKDCSLSLSQSEQKKLCSMANNKDVRMFALALLKKRLRQIKKILPATCTLLAGNLSNLFQAFADDKPTIGVKRHLIDASNFANYLTQNKSVKLLELDEYKAVLEYEKAWVDSELSPLVLKLKCFKHDISNYIIQLKNQEKDQSYLGKPRVCIWFRLSSNYRLLYWELFPRFWPK